jgi:hypothetical protein
MKFISGNQINPIDQTNYITTLIYHQDLSEKLK